MNKISEAKQAMRLKEWSEMYQGFLESGKTVHAWCDEQKLSVKTFYYRLRRVRETALEKHEIVPLTQGTMIAAPLNHQQKEQAIKIIANDIVIELPTDIAPEMVAAIARGIGRC